MGDMELGTVQTELKVDLKKSKAWVYILICLQKFLHFSKNAGLFFVKFIFVPIFVFYMYFDRKNGN